MRVLVTGRSGYIGNLAAQQQMQEQGHQVCVYDNLSTGQVCLALGFDFVVESIPEKEELLPIFRETDAVMQFCGILFRGRVGPRDRKH